MSQEIDAIYNDGVIKPLTPLELPDQTRVKIILELQPSAPPPQPKDEWEKALLGIARDCGVSLSNSSLSSDELYD